MSTAALIPAFNEEKNITEVIRLTRSSVRNSKIIVIDDGSKDNTYSLAKKERVTVLKHSRNKGKGEAMNTGLRYVLKNLPSIKHIVFIDADMQLDPRQAPRLLRPLKQGKADVIMGYRDFSKVPLRHKLGNWLWRTSFNLLFGTRLKDTNCGYVAMTRKAAKRIRVHGGYIIETSILKQAVENRFTIKQVPVSVDYEKISKVPRGIRIVLGVFVYIISEGLKYRFSGK